MGLPTISIQFYQAAADVVNRSATGTMLLCLTNNEGNGSSESVTETDATYIVYSASEVDADSVNLNAVHKAMAKRCFVSGGCVTKLIIMTGASASACLTTAMRTGVEQFAYACAGVSDATDRFNFASYIASYSTSPTVLYKIKGVCQTANSFGFVNEHVILVESADLSFTDGTNITAANFYQYIPRICAILCSCPITQSVTYRPLEEVKTIANSTDIVSNSIYLAYRDDAIRLSKAIASDGTSVATVEAKDLIRGDIVTVWTNNYLSRKRNTKDNELSFCAMVKGYLLELQEQGVINPDEDITVAQDIAAMREAHPTYYQGHDDLWVSCHPYAGEVYVSTQIYLCDIMEDLYLRIFLE